jgi:glycosyltransferase involved in cell wall biosynthesis
LKKLAIITTHPIQYNAPFFRLLAERGKVNVRVFYTWGEKVLADKYDPGFGKIITWDIPLLEGYDFTMVENKSKKPGSDHFNGIINPSLNNQIESWGANAVLVFGWAFNSHLKCLRYFKGKIPVFFRGDSTLLDKKNNVLTNTIKSIFLKWVYKNVDIAFFVGEQNKKYFIHYGLKENQLIFAPHAVDNIRFSYPLKKDIKSELGIKESNILFLFAGKFELKKNPELLLEAFIQLNDFKTHLLFVGNGFLENRLKEKYLQLSKDLQSRIHFKDFQNQLEMPDIYKSADVFVLPSKGPRETWGLAVNEAMASGLPVLVSDKCGCNNDLIEDGINGYTFESDNLSQLVSKMNKMVNDSEALKQMGRNSKNKIQFWSFESIAMVIEEKMNKN